MWPTLIANLAAVALLVSAWNHGQGHLDTCPRRLRTAIFGAVMGCGGVISMLLAVRLEPGVIFDLRASLIAVAGFLGGPAAGVIAALVAAGCRVWIGGQGMGAGLLAIGSAAGIGALGHMLLQGRCARLGYVLTLAAAVAAMTTLTFWMLPAAIRTTALNQFGLAVGLINFAATAVAALAILHMRELAGERELLRTALAQAPDFQFVKNRRGEFVAVNQRVAEHNGAARPAHLRGRTDFDLTTAGRARKLFEEEREVMRTGVAIVDKEERLAAIHGGTSWFSTSKSPLRDGDGVVIGLAGVTRDVTRSKQHQTALVLGQNLVMDGLAEVSDGLALIDAVGCVAYHNRRLPDCMGIRHGETLFGMHLVELLRAGAKPLGLRHTEAEAWARRTGELLTGSGEIEVQFADLRFVRLRSRRVRDGATALVVSEVTRQREAERMLDTFTENLRMLTRANAVHGAQGRKALDRDIQVALAQAAALRNTLAA